MKKRFKIVIEYDGTKYKGWQRLGNTDQTIQQKVESVISRVTDETIEIHGSGRTDNGVHALGQVAHFDTKKAIDMDKFQFICNEMLPQDIVIKQVEEVSLDFHARFSAKSKKYVYKVWNNNVPSAIHRKFSHHVNSPLDIATMKEASKYLIGEHDFQSFTANKSKKKSMVRNLMDVKIEKKGDFIEFQFYGEGFLYKMVRIMVGTLIEIGLGTRKPIEIKQILEAKNRQAAGETAPSQGLYLLEVNYE